MGRFNEVKLTSEQKRKLEIAQIGLMVDCPFYADIFANIGKGYVITREVGTLATDGRQIIINPDYFDGLTKPEQVFVLAHEIDHIVGRHPTRFKSYRLAGTIKGKPVDLHFANVCADYVINANLVATGIGSCKPDWLLHPSVKGDELWEDVYERLWQDAPTQPPPNPQPGRPCPEGVPGPSPGTGSSEKPPETADATQPKSGHVTRRAKDNNSGRKQYGKPDPKAEANAGAFDEVFDPPVDPVTGDVDLPDENEFREAIARAASVAKAVGKLPGNIQRMVDEILAPQISWRDQIRLTMTGLIGSRGESWRRPNRRRLALNPIVMLPGRAGYGCETVVVAVDTSGSVSQQELDAYMGEVGGILADVKPRRIIVIGCDAQVTQVDEVRSLDEFDGVRAKGIKGGGGTSFRPVFEYVEQEELRPEALIYCTDLQGAFPEEPAYPVVWCATTNDPVPFGDVVRLTV
jgi:predicted metal-dependent peptidase